MTQPIFLNGLNGSTGQPMQTGILTTDLLARIARQQKLFQDDLRDVKLRQAHNLRSKHQMGTAEGIDIADLAQAGWGVIFPATLDTHQTAAIKEALQPLLNLRREQASRNNPTFYREFIGPELGYRPDETKNGFLKRFGRGAGAANPTLGVPFYLLIVGSPEQIPFEFQYQLDVQYGVGRIYFDDLPAYAIYAQSVVQAEHRQILRAKQITFFAPSHDEATRLSSKRLVGPLANQVYPQYPDWKVQTIAPEQSTKATMGALFGDSATPAILFSAGHGLGFNLNDSCQLPHTGALVTQDILGYTGGRISEQFYFSADDLPADANVSGLIAFFFACFGAGSPRLDNFSREALGKEIVIAPHPFLSQLPLKLLSHPRGGALGAFAHIDRAWSYSFLWEANTDVETFRSLLCALMNGKPAGAAGDYFGMRYGEISSELQNANATDTHPDEYQIADWWAAARDARNYVFIGDPAVRLSISG